MTPSLGRQVEPAAERCQATRSPDDPAHSCGWVLEKSGLHEQAAFGWEPAGLAVEQAGVVPTSTGFEDSEFRAGVEGGGEGVVVDVAIALAGDDFAGYDDGVGSLAPATVAAPER